MELDNQLEGILSRSAEQLKTLSIEKQKLDQANQALLAHIKAIESDKNSMMEAIKEATTQNNADIEKKFKVQNDIHKAIEEITLLESKNLKQIAINKKYEDTMIKQMEEIKKQTATNDETRNKEKDAEEAYLSSLESKNNNLQKGIEEELIAIEKYQVTGLLEKNKRNQCVRNQKK